MAVSACSYVKSSTSLNTSGNTSKSIVIAFNVMSGPIALYLPHPFSISGERNHSPATFLQNMIIEQMKSTEVYLSDIENNLKRISLEKQLKAHYDSIMDPCQTSEMI